MDRPAKPRYALAAAAATGALARFTGRAEGAVPPVPIDRLIEEAGFRIVELREMPDGFSGIVSLRDRLIGVNGCHHRHRRRFSLAHEFGHVLLDHPPEVRCSAAGVRLFDREADRCASELLMPEQLLLPLLTRTGRPETLARIFDVSPEAMRIRLLQLERGRR